MFKINGKIPIFISPLFWVLAALIGWLNSQSFYGTAIWMVIIFFSVLIHEYGHALTAMAFGQRARIELAAFGGVTQRQGGPKLKLWQEFLVVLNGPMAGFALCGVAWVVQNWLAVAYPNSLAASVAYVTAAVNLFWTIINLLPVQPLDGGKLLGIVLQSVMGVRGIKVALFISLAFALGLGLFFFSRQEFLAGAIFLMLMFESYRQWRESLDITEEDQKQELQNLLQEAEASLLTGHPDVAFRKYMQVREQAKAGVVYLAATEKAAGLLNGQGQFKAAYELMNPIKSKLSPGALRLQLHLAYRLAHFEEAVALGKLSYQYYADYETAVINALCHAALGQPQPAIGWLQRAVSDGLPDLKEVLSKREFDGIRQDPQFRALEAS